MAKKKSIGRPFIGDQILAVYQGLGSCCGIGVLSLLSAASFGLAGKPDIVKSFQAEHPSDIWKFFSDPKYTVTLGIGLALLAILDVVWIIGTWRGRRWSFWTHGILNGLGVVPSLALGANHLSLIIPSAICIYCVLRLTGNVGPKGKTRR